MYTRFVKNVTFSLDDELLVKSRAYAAQRGTTLNQLVRDLLSEKVTPLAGESMTALFEWVDEKAISTDGVPLTRDQAHER